MDLHSFVADSDPVVAVLAGDAAAAGAVRFAVPAYVVREVRGAKMPTVPAVFDEFAAAFQFPWYFGENKDAFDECMRDLDEFVGAAPGYLVVVRDAEQLLAAATPELAWFLAATTFYAESWAARQVAFRVVLQTGQPEGWLREFTRVALPGHLA